MMESIHERDGISTPSRDEHLDQVAAEKVDTTHPIRLDEAQTPSPQRVHAKTFLALFAMCLIYFAETFALIGAGSQSQIIAAHFHHPGDSVWVTACLTIPSVIFGPIVAQTADYWGRKGFLVGTTTIGAVGCIIISRASSFAILVAGLTITGLKLSALPLLHTVPSEILPRRWRAQAQAAVMIANAFGLVTGLTLGGLFNRNGNPDGFRNYFYIAVGLFALAALTCYIAYQPPKRMLQTTLSTRQKLESLDWVGYGLLASSLVLVCIGLSWSQNPYKWSNAHTSAPFAIGVALAIALIVYETKFKADGMFHHGLFSRNRNFAISLLAVFCEGLAFFAATVYFSFQVGMLYEEDTLLGSVRFSVAFISTIPASVITGLYCAYTKKIRWITVLAFLIFVAFFACMATTDQSSGSNVWGYPVLLGSALGMTLITLLTVAQLSTPPELISIASGLAISIRSLGGTIGIAIYHAVFNDEMRHVGQRVAKAALGAGLQPDSVERFVGNILGHNETGLSQMRGVTPEIIQAGRNAMLDTYVQGFQNVWATAAAFVGLSAIAAAFLIDPSQEFNNQIDASVEKAEDLSSS